VRLLGRGSDSITGATRASVCVLAPLQAPANNLGGSLVRGVRYVVSWGTCLRRRLAWIRGKLVSVSAARLARPNGFAESSVSGYYPSHTPQTPALVSRELGDSRRALTCPGVAMCLAGPSRSLQVARRAALTPCREAGSECVVRYGGRWSALRDSGGLRPSRIQRPASRNPKRGFGGEIQRPVPAVAPPLARGIGGATAYLLASATGALRCHWFLRTPRANSHVWSVVLSFPRWPARTVEEGT
jgi:hypothetical protein